MSEQMERDAGTKRKVEELTQSDSESSTEKTAENLAKKVKTPANNRQAQSTAPVVTPAPAPATSQGTTTCTLISGAIYRVQCPELGDFHIRAGATGGFCVKAATLIVSDAQGTKIFPDPSTSLIDGAEVEVQEDILSGATTLSVIPVRPKPPPQDQHWLAALVTEVIRGAPATPPLRIVGAVDQDIIINGGRSAMITGNGGRLVFSGSGTVMVEGSLQTLQNNSNGRVRVHGKVTGEVRQTGCGSIVITEDLNGNITNCGGGSIEVKGLQTGDSKQVNNTRGTVWIGTGPNNGGTKEYYYSKNYKIIHLN